MIFKGSALVDEEMLSKVIIILVVLVFFSVPASIMLLYKPTRMWFKNAIENWDNRLDPEDLSRLTRIIAFIFSLIILGFMVVAGAILSIKFPIEAWIIMGGIAMGAEFTDIVRIIRRKRE